MIDPTAEPVRIVIERRVPPAARASFERWLQALLDHAATAEGSRGSSVMTVEDDWFIQLRFAQRADLERWQRSPDAAALLAPGAIHSATRDAQPPRAPAATVWQSLRRWFRGGG